nr:MAG TPA: hypothetical protein [Caudoviricetes sp.]
MKLLSMEKSVTKTLTFQNKKNLQNLPERVDLGDLNGATYLNDDVKSLEV